MAGVAVKVDNVSKSFKLPHEKYTSIKSLVVNFYRRRRSFEVQEALKNVSFEVKEGEFFGIVGRNGSGKSTLLKILAEIYYPTTGSITVNGPLTPFIELGVGFNMELTGRDNIFLNGTLLGLTRKEIQRIYPEVVEFAELGNFMDQKLKNYSSGMLVRLAFSIAIQAQRGILLIDEVLAVGDAAFQTKCFDYFRKLKKEGTTVVFVSHDRGALERFCDRGVLIDDGKLIAKGSIKHVLNQYSDIVLRELGKSDKEVKSIASDYAELTVAEAFDKNGKASKRFKYGDKVGIRFRIKFKRALRDPIFGVTVQQRGFTDRAIFTSNTLLDGQKKTGQFKVGDVAEYSIPMPDLLNDGEYLIEPAMANEQATIFYIQKPAAATFRIAGSPNPYSFLSVPRANRLKKL